MSKLIRLPTLLVIADNPSIRFWVKKQLDDQFFVITAEKKGEALSALETRLDFIIVDSEFADCDSLELCKEMGKITQKSSVPIWLITGRLKKSYRQKARESGVTDFLSDQLDVDELNARIEAGLKAASMRQKTEDIGLAIPSPKKGESNYLKNKQVKKGHKK